MSEMFGVWVEYYVDIPKVHLIYCYIILMFLYLLFYLDDLSIMGYSTHLLLRVTANMSYFQYCGFYETEYTKFGTYMFSILMCSRIIFPVIGMLCPSLLLISFSWKSVLTHIKIRILACFMVPFT